MKTVYFARMGKTGPIKIGIAGDVGKRLKALSDGAPDLVELIATIEGGREIELRLHRALHASKRRGEWFNPTPEVRGVSVLARDYGLNAVLLWLDAKAQQVEVRPLQFETTDDPVADILAMLPICISNVAARHGKAIAAEAMGRSQARLELAISPGYDIPVTTLYGLMNLDPGAFEPIAGRSALLKSRGVA